jgi:hypothetical protein
MWESVKRWPGRFARSGYAAGALIQRLRLDWQDLDCETTAPDGAEFRARGGDVQFLVRELLESHFMMHIASAEFICRCPLGSSAPGPPGAGAGAGAVIARHRGRIRRTGIEYRLEPAASDATRRLRDMLSRDPELTAALMPLDFTHCRFNLMPGLAEMRVRHFGACEIVGQLPRFRRYVRMGRAQCDSLLQSIGAFRRLIQA